MRSQGKGGLKEKLKPVLSRGLETSGTPDLGNQSDFGIDHLVMSVYRSHPFHVYIDNGLRDSARTTAQTLKTVSTEVTGVLSQVLFALSIFVFVALLGACF